MKLINWTKKDDEYLRKYYNVKCINSLSILLNRTERAVKERAYKLKLNKPRTFGEDSCRLEDAFDNGLYYKYLDFAKTLDPSIDYVTEAWEKYGKSEFELMYKENSNG